MEEEICGFLSWSPAGSNGQVQQVILLALVLNAVDGVGGDGLEDGGNQQGCHLVAQACPTVGGHCIIAAFLADTREPLCVAMMLIMQLLLLTCRVMSSPVKEYPRTSTSFISLSTLPLLSTTWTMAPTASHLPRSLGQTGGIAHRHSGFKFRITNCYEQHTFLKVPDLSVKPLLVVGDQRKCRWDLQIN